MNGMINKIWRKKYLLLLLIAFFVLLFTFKGTNAGCDFTCATLDGECSMHLWLGGGTGIPSCTLGSFYDSGAWGICWRWWPGNTWCRCNDCRQGDVRWIENYYCPNTWNNEFDEKDCTVIVDAWDWGCYGRPLPGKWDAPYRQCVKCDSRMKVKRFNDPDRRKKIDELWSEDNPPKELDPSITNIAHKCEAACGASRECDDKDPSYTTCTNGAPQHCNYNSQCVLGPPNPKCDSYSICGGSPQCNGIYTGYYFCSEFNTWASCMNCNYDEGFCDNTHCNQASHWCQGKKRNTAGCTSASVCGGHCRVECDSYCQSVGAVCNVDCNASPACDGRTPNSSQCTSHENGDYYKCDPNCIAGSWQDCGVSSCGASCPGVGCNWVFRYCSVEEGGCQSQIWDLDNYEDKCKTCMGNPKLWQAGGDISNCCGDDPNEYLLECRYNTTIWSSVDESPCKGVQAINEACCDSATDCVWKDNCIANGQRLPINSSVFCNNGVWDYIGTASIYEVRIFDEEAHYCRATACANAYGTVVSCIVQESEGNLTIGTLVGANQPPDFPLPPDGPSRANVDELVSFSASTTDPDGDQIKYEFDWGDGTTSESIYVNSGDVVVLSHSWSSAGTYCVKVKAIDNNSLSYGYSACHWIKINAPPSVPIIYGPTFGKIGETYEYNVSSVDPEGDFINYIIFWEYSLEVPNSTSISPTASGINYTFSHVWFNYGLYCIKAQAIDVWGAKSALSPCLEMRINSPPRIPKLIGPDIGTFGETYEYMANTTDPDGDQIKYEFDWGDGTTTSLTSFVDSGTSQNMSHTFNLRGQFCVRARAIDNNSLMSAWSPCIPMIVNSPPTIPSISGTDEGKAFNNYGFEFLSTDPDGDQIQYEIDWGDGNKEITSVSDSGVSKTVNHIWTIEGTFCVRARAIDLPFLAASDWSPCFNVIISGVKNWPMFKYNNKHIGSIDLGGPIVNKTLWKFNTGGMIISSPAVVDDIVYFGSLDHNLYAVYAVNGTSLWNYTTGDAIFSSPAVSNNIVYFGSLDNKFYALNARTGALIWSYNVGSSIWSSPIVHQGKVFFGADDGKLYALDANTGAFIWSYNTGSAHIYSSPAATGDSVYFGDWNGKIYALYANNGTLKWSYNTGGIIEGAPVIVDNILYIGSQDGKLYALYANNGTLKWSYSSGNMIYGSAVVSGNKVIFGSGNSVYALFTENGSLKWSKNLGGSTIDTHPIIADLLYVPTGNGLYALTPYDGGIIWSHSIGQFIEGSLAVANITSSSRFYPNPIIQPDYYITGDNILFIGIGSSLYAIFDNSAPNVPIITGPKTGYPGTSYTYTFNSSDPNWDKIKYVVDWGDGTISSSGYLDSGTSYTVSHTWSNYGTYTIKVTVYDEHLWNSTNTTKMSFCYPDWNNVTYFDKSAVKSVTNIVAIRITVKPVNDSYSRCYGSWARYSNGTYVALGTYHPPATQTCHDPNNWDGWCNCIVINGETTITHNLVDYGITTPFTGTIETRVSDGCCGAVGDPKCGTPTYWLVNWTSILFQDDFNDGNDNGWTRIKGTWYVDNGIYYQNDSYFYPDTLDYLSVAGDVNWINYTLEADVRNTYVLPSSPDSESMSLVFRYTPNASVPLGGEFYRVMLEDCDPPSHGACRNAYIEYANGWDGAWVAHPGISGWEVLNSTSFNYDPLVWHHFKVEVMGPNIKWWVDGNLLLTAYDTRLTKGKIGVLSNKPTQFDNVIVHDDPTEPISSASSVLFISEKENEDKTFNISFPLLRISKDILYKTTIEEKDSNLGINYIKELLYILDSITKNSKELFNYYVSNTLQGFKHLSLNLRHILNFYLNGLKIFGDNLKSDLYALMQNKETKEHKESFAFPAYSQPPKITSNMMVNEKINTLLEKHKENNIDPPFRCPDFDKDEIINVEIIIKKDALGGKTKVILGIMDDFGRNKVEWSWSTGSNVIYSIPQRISGLPRCMKINETISWDNEINANEEMTFICQFDARDYRDISPNNPLNFTIYTCWDGFDANGDGSFDCRSDAISVFNASTTIGMNGPLHDVRVKRVGSLDLKINSIIPSLESGKIEVNGTIDFVYQNGVSRYALNSSTEGGDCPGGKCIVCALLGADEEGVLWVRDDETTRYDYGVDRPSWLQEWVGLIYKKSDGPLNLYVPGMGSFVSDYWFDGIHRTESSSYPKNYALSWSNSLYNDTLVWFGITPGAIDDPAGINNTLYYDSFQGCCNDTNSCVNPNTYGSLNIKGVCGGGYKKDGNIFKSTEFDESVNPSGGNIMQGFHLIRFITTNAGFNCLKDPSVSAALNCNYDYYAKSCCVRKGMSCSEEEGPYNVYYANPETGYLSMLPPLPPLLQCSDTTNASYSEAKCEKLKFYENKDEVDYLISASDYVREKRFDRNFPQFNVKNSKTIKVEYCDVNETGHFNCTVPYKEFKAKYLACVAKNKYASGYKVVSYNTTKICLNFQVSHDTIHTIYTDFYLPILVGWNETYGFFYPDSPIEKLKNMTNLPPLIPNITGPVSGRINTAYNFQANTTDPNGDLVKFVFDWGDGTISESEYVDPSMLAVMMNHSWSTTGVKCIKVKAIDIYGAESDFSSCYNINIVSVPICGNGVVDPGEVCDPSATPNGCPPNQVCKNWCTRCTTCGNGIIDPAEECDPMSPIDTCGPFEYCSSVNCFCRPMIGCLEKGSLILTPSGYRRIEEIKEGDIVIGYENWRKVMTKVLKTAVHQVNTTLYYYKGYWFTGNHLVYTDDYKEFKSVTEFTNITKHYVGEVYDIQTEIGNYFGTDNFLIHNKPIPV
ncbi:MAG: PQQ-binding-like beta-propeller repeat protein [Candidatus Nanoarchaeia archaeon]